MTQSLGVTRRYLITLVGSERKDGARTITVARDPADPIWFEPPMFAVDSKYLKDYVPNAGDTLIRNTEDGSIRFEEQGRKIRYLFRKQESTGIWIQEMGPFHNQAEADECAGKLALDTGVCYSVGICVSEDGRELIQEFPI